MAVSRFTLGVRALSTGPQIPHPHSHYWGKWNVSERIIQLPHPRFMMFGKPYPDVEKKFQRRKETWLINKTRTKVNKRLLEIAEEEAKVRRAQNVEGEEISEVAAEESDVPEVPRVSLFNRAYRPVPPQEVEMKLFDIAKTIYPIEGKDSDWKAIELTDLQKKFELLDMCAKQFRAIVPNSRLNEIQTLGDFLGYMRRDYEPIRHFKKLEIDDLPPNVTFQCREELELYSIDRANSNAWSKALG